MHPADLHVRALVQLFKVRRQYFLFGRGKLKDVELKLLLEIMKNSRKSDRALAKSIGVSQPTFSRLLKKMQKDFGMTFTASADLAKIGFELVAITFGKQEKEPVDPQKVKQLLDGFNNCIIFASTGRSSDIDSDRMIISVHKSYSDYVEFKEYLRTEWNGLVSVGSSFIISLKSDKVIRPISTHYLFETKPEQPS